mmetsp:Transcript_10419/g.38699  ORF Transcript_10419/g.38699 Transcript_10419/m.38699 type:complete len:86 (+) Transcript_10419:1723-1980(+)
MLQVCYHVRWGTCPNTQNIGHLCVDASNSSNLTDNVSAPPRAKRQFCTIPTRTIPLPLSNLTIHKTPRFILPKCVTTSPHLPQSL